MIEGSGCGSKTGSGSGSIPLTNGSWSGSRRPKNLWIRIRIRIRNIARKWSKNSHWTSSPGCLPPSWDLGAPEHIATELKAAPECIARELWANIWLFKNQCLWISIVMMLMIRIRLSILMPVPIRIPIPSFSHVGKSYFLVLFTVAPVNFVYLSRQRHQWINFRYFWEYTDILWKKYSLTLP
jgi:hypothetical protein